jgi:threonine dehydrogenase-like Zn-dependent dehydrogenase
MKALSLTNKGDARIVEVLGGAFSADMNSFRGNNLPVTFHRVQDQEIAATVSQGRSGVPAGKRVTVSPYTTCGHCASRRRGRFNSYRNNQTFGVQRDG